MYGTIDVVVSKCGKVPKARVRDINKLSDIISTSQFNIDIISNREKTHGCQNYFLL